MEAEVAKWVGIILGAIVILSALYVLIRRPSSNVFVPVVLVLGILLLGPDIWSTLHFSWDADGGFKVDAVQEVRVDVAGATAKINGDMEKVNLKVAELSQDFAAFKALVPAATQSLDLAARHDVVNEQFTRNSGYSILIFYRPEQKAKAGKLVQKLLAAGYNSSAISTDLKEAVKQFDSNTAWVITTQRAQSQMPALTEIFSGFKADLTFEYREGTYNLRTGDVQVLIF